MRRWLMIGIPVVLLLIIAVVMLYTDHEPGLFNVEDSAATHAARHGHNHVTGYVTTATLIEVGQIMLDFHWGDRGFAILVIEGTFETMGAFNR